MIVSGATGIGGAGWELVGRSLQVLGWMQGEGMGKTRNMINNAEDPW